MYDTNNDVSAFGAEITPDAAAGQLFINPFAVDPNDEQVLFYPAGLTLWRSTDAGASWSALTSLNLSQSCRMSAVAVSQRNPDHVLYIGASCNSESSHLYRLDAAPSAPGSELREITVPDAVVPDGGTLQGAYLHDIAVNPTDGDEILVVHSNYNIRGLYHSADGGESYTAVEGNLSGDVANPGPSLRSAAMLPGPGGGTTYILGTSTGLYATTMLDGTSTRWVQEAGSSLGNAVVEFVDARAVDLRVAAATHGRGIFIGQGAELPSIVLDDFTASPGANTMVLSWTTSLEFDNEGFELQMAEVDRQQSTAPSNWQTADFIEGHGAGITSTLQSYSHRIPYVLPGTYRFRLKQVSLDGQTQFFPNTGDLEAIVMVDGTHQLTANYPNPFGDRTQFALSVGTRQSVQIHLYDIRGRRVRTLFDGELPAAGRRCTRVPRRCEPTSERRILLPGGGP